MKRNTILIFAAVIMFSLVAGMAVAQNQPGANALEDLGSPDEVVRKQALECLITLGPSSMPTLLSGLQAGDEQDRRQAAIALGMLGPDAASATAALSQLMQTAGSHSMRAAAARALASVGARGIEELTAGLHHRDSQVRHASIGALQSMQTMARPAVEELIAALQHDDPVVRCGAIALLGEIGGEAEPAIPSLVRILRDGSNRREQWRAAGSLARMGAASVDILEGVMTSGARRTRAAAAIALIGTGERGQHVVAERLTANEIPLLVEAIDQPDKQFPWWAARALELMGSPAVEPLGGLLSRDDDNIQLAVIYALLRMERMALPALPALLAVLDDGNRDVRHRALYAVQRMGRSAVAAVPHLIEVMRTDPDFRMYHSAIRILAVFGPESAAATPDLIEAFQREEAIVSMMASRTLSRIGEAALPAVVEGLGSPNKRVRRGCAMTMAQIPEQAVPILLEVLEGQNLAARVAAADALRRIGLPARHAESALRTIVQNNQADRQLREVAIAALARMTTDTDPISPVAKHEISPLIPLPSSGLPAFPGAEGFGSTTAGGRGGRVMMVTNLNDSGPGSLRFACAAKGPRIVVFRISGIIELEKRLDITEPRLTIAGQTAPGGGICLKNYGLRVIDTHDVIVRHLRMRSGDLTRENHDALDVFRSHDVVIDHCSMSWGTDEVLDTVGDVEVSFGWCMITEGLPDGWHPADTHGKGSLLSAERGGITMHHCLHAHHKRRSPRIGGKDEDEAGVVFDCRNNVIYNWGDRAGQSTVGPVRINYVGNYLKPGPSTTPETRGFAFAPGGPLTRLSMARNLIEGVREVGEQDWQMIDWTDGGSEREVRVDQPFPTPAVTTMDPRAAYEQVLRQAGATLPARDAVDVRIIEEVRSGRGAMIDSQSWVGGWPYYHQEPAPPDSDWDGMPDDWERRHSLNPHDPADNSGDADRDGYTNIEEFLNQTDPESDHAVSGE